jgi:small-conductance mechanosensitive channel
LLGFDFQSSRISTFVILLCGVAQVAHWLTKLSETWIARGLRSPGSETPHSATGLLTFGARITIWSLGALVLLGNAGVDITALVAGLGIGGIAVAFALQNILGDLFASLSIVLDRPFAVGDFITVDDVQGTVEQIGVKTTRIRSLSGEQILVSNSDLLKSRIRNFKRMRERRSLFRVGVTYETQLEKLKAIPRWLREIVEAQPRTRFDRAHLLAFGDSALTFEVVYFVLAPEFVVLADTQHAIHLALVEKFESEGVSFAYPTRTVYSIPRTTSPS